MPPIVRFFRHVDRRDSCWLWTGAIQSKGYGLFNPRYGQPVLAHRFSYEQAFGRIPDGLTLDHLCRVKRCVRVSHLEPVTAVENLRRHYARLAAEGGGHRQPSSRVVR